MVNDNKYDIKLYTGISYNIPIQRSIGKIITFMADTTTGIFDCNPTITTPDPDELIVDNEDQGFSLIEPGKILNELFEKEFNRYYEWPHNALRWTKNYNYTYHGEINKKYSLQDGWKRKLQGPMGSNRHRTGRVRDLRPHSFNIHGYNHLS